MPKERVKKERKRRKQITYNKIIRDFHIPEDYREKIIRDLKRGASPTALATKYKVMVSTIRDLAEELVAKGELVRVVKSRRVVYYAAKKA